MKTSLLAFFLFLPGTIILGQKSADLKLNLQKNTVYRFKSASDQTISQTVNGVQQNSIVKSSSIVSLKMIDATPEFIIAEIHFDTINTNSNAMGVNSIFSSAREGDIKSSDMSEVMSCIFNRLSKNGIFAKMVYTGKVIEIVNYKMLSDIMLKDTNLITGQMAPIIKTQIKNMVGDEALKTMVESFTNYLPARRIGTGEKWTVSLSLNSGGMSFDVLTNYTLDGIQSDKADVTAEANIKASENADPMEYGGARITYGNISGLSRFDMFVDIRTGLILESKGKSHITGNLDVSAQGMNMQIPMEITGESRIVALP